MCINRLSRKAIHSRNSPYVGAIVAAERSQVEGLTAEILGGIPLANGFPYVRSVKRLFALYAHGCSDMTDVAK